MTRRRLTGMNAKDGEAIPKPSRHSTDSCSNHAAAGNDRRCHARWLFMLSARPSAGATIVKVGLLAPLDGKTELPATYKLASE